MTTPSNALTLALGGTPREYPEPEAGNRLAFALEYAKHGFRVLPAWWITRQGNCACPSGAACGKKAGKHPIPTDWQHIASTDEVQIRDWWKHYPTANIALLMGSGVCAVDIDNEYALEELDRRKTPSETPTQRTGSGGLHRLYRHTGKRLRNAVRFMDGADIRTEGGIIIVEPSTNMNGAYAWEVERHPFDMPLAELPAWIADLCAYENAVARPSIKLSDLWTGIPEGERNGRVFSYACKMRRDKRPDLEILAVCLELGRRCRPPMTDGEVTSIVASSGRYAEKRDDDGLVCISVWPDLMEMEIKPRVEIISPWLREQDICMIHAWRGIGKTWAILSLGVSIATGTPFMRWKTTAPRGVLLVDGEMSLHDLRYRLAQLIKGAGANAPQGRFALIAHDSQERGIPSLDTSEGQEKVERDLEGIDVLILDNVSTLFRGSGDENDSSSWSAAQDWLLKLRRIGKTVILVHHSGKSGAQRGTSKREDILNAVISCRRPSDYQETQGARFEIKFEKLRGVSGPLVEPIEVQLDADDKTGATWLLKTLVESRDDQILDMLDLGMAQRVMAQEMGCSMSTVARTVRKLKKAGRVSTPRSDT